MTIEIVAQFLGAFENPAVRKKDGGTYKALVVNYMEGSRSGTINIHEAMFGRMGALIAKIKKIEQGTTVTFIFEQNGNFKNLVDVKAGGEVSTTPESKSSTPSKFIPTKPTGTFNDIGIKVGHAINNAVLLYTANQDSTGILTGAKLEAELLGHATMIMKLSDKLKEGPVEVKTADVDAIVKAAAKPAVKKAVKKAEVEPDFEDDLDDPFEG